MKKTLLSLCLLGLALPQTQAQPRQQGTGEERTRCVPTGDIVDYRVESDELVRLKMRDANDILMRLRRHCPQLYFHKYISYTPVNGQLCEGLDDVVSRSGMPCRIASFTDDIPSATPAPATRERDTR